MNQNKVQSIKYKVLSTAHCELPIANCLLLLLTAAFFCLLLLPTAAFSQNVSINTTGNPPNASALLDLDASTANNRGLLIPRVTFAERTGVNFNPLPAAAQALLVYQTNAGGEGEGYYYNTSTTTTPAWVKLFSNTTGWSLTGNAGTTVGTNFLGTTDAVDFAVFTNNTERIRVTSAGNVGIGTTGPIKPFHVQGGIYRRFLVPVSSEVEGIAVIGQATPDPSTGSLLFEKARGDFSAGVTAALVDDLLGSIIWKGRQAGAYQRAAQIQGVADIGWSDIGTDSPGRLEFSTTPDGSNTLAERMRITSAGNVGIGTTTPGAPLDVNSSDGLASIMWGRGGSALDGVLLHSIGGVNNIGIASTLSGGAPLHFLVGGTSSAYIMMSILFSGNVGIGTTAPTSVFSVNGVADKPGGGAWAVFSDERLKKDVRPFTDGLNVLEKISPVTFKYNGKAGITVQDTYVGVIAQQMQEIAPYTVKTVKMKLDTSDVEPTDILEFDPNALWYININAIKELKAEIKEHKVENETLKRVIDALKSENESLKAVTKQNTREIAKINALLGVSTKK